MNSFAMFLSPAVACNWGVLLHGAKPQSVGRAGQGSLTPPGTICATPCEVPVDVEDGLPVDVPLVYYFGHVTPSDNEAGIFDNTL